MLGNLPREKAIGILKISDIYLHSSMPGGGLSTSLLEAMICNCAVIATPNEGADEVIKNNENGILIKRTDTNLAMEQIVHLIKNKQEIKRYSEKSKIDIHNNFNWKKSINLYAEIFKKR